MKGPGHEGSCKNSGESAAIFLLSTLASMGLNFNSELEFRPRGTCAKIGLTLEKSDTCRAGRHGGQVFLSCGSDVGLLGEQDAGWIAELETSIKTVSCNKQYDREIALLPMESEAEDYVFIVFHLNVFLNVQPQERHCPVEADAVRCSHWGILQELTSGGKDSTFSMSSNMKT